MKFRKFIMFLVCGAMLTACSQDEEKGETNTTPIRLESGISTTRGIQDTKLVSGEKVYVWAFQEETSGITDWVTNPYLKAWTLTADGANGLSGSKRYYPPKSLSMVAIHGNFSFTENTSNYTATVTHTIETDQNTSGNYEKSDLLYWKGQGKTTTSNPINVDFTHKLSKIEITLTSSYYSDSQLGDAIVTLNNVLPTVDLSMSNGAISAAKGTATIITTRKASNTLREAVIPPQAKPSNFISVKMRGSSNYVDAVVTSFTANEKYVYNVELIAPIYLRNPLWYLEENYVKSVNSTLKVVTFDTDPTTAGSLSGWTWADAMRDFTGNSASYDGYRAGGLTNSNGLGYTHHLPTQQEWTSIIPALTTNASSQNLWSASNPGNALITEPTCTFGYNTATKAGINGRSYWSAYASNRVRYGIRFIGTPYCSAWKYYQSGNCLIICSRLIDNIDESETETKMTEITGKADSWWNEDLNNGAIKRILFGTGIASGVTGEGVLSNSSDLGQRNYIWTTTETSSTQAAHVRVFMAPESSHILHIRSNGDNFKIFSMAIRLFRDN